MRNKSKNSAIQGAVEHKHPDASVQVVSTVATSFFTVGIAFFGYWAFGPTSNNKPWGAIDFFTIFLSIIAFLFLSITPFVATQPSSHPNFKKTVSRARLTLLIGVSSLVIAIFFALLPGLYESYAQLTNRTR